MPLHALILVNAHKWILMLCAYLWPWQMGLSLSCMGTKEKNLLPPFLGSDKASKHPSTSNNAAATWVPRTANMSPGANRVQVPLFADTHFNDTNTKAH